MEEAAERLAQGGGRKGEGAERETRRETSEAASCKPSAVVTFSHSSRQEEPGSWQQVPWPRKARSPTGNTTRMVSGAGGALSGRRPGRCWVGSRTPPLSGLLLQSQEAHRATET